MLYALMQIFFTKYKQLMQKTNFFNDKTIIIINIESALHEVLTCLIKKSSDLQLIMTPLFFSKKVKVNIFQALFVKNTIYTITLSL